MDGIYGLSVKYGQLYAAGELLVCIYPAGDCDTIRWPFPQDSTYWTRDSWEQALRRALFDARETGQIPDVTEVLLPDGTVFMID